MARKAEKQPGQEAGVKAKERVRRSENAASIPAEPKTEKQAEVPEQQTRSLIGDYVDALKKSGFQFEKGPVKPQERSGI